MPGSRLRDPDLSEDSRRPRLIALNRYSGLGLYVDLVRYNCPAMQRRIFRLLATVAFAITAYAQEHAPEPAKSGFHPTFDNIAGAIGILAAIVAVIAYLDQRRTNKENASVIALAEKYMNKEGAEQTIAQISEQLQEMPRLARRAVLQEQSERLKLALSETYLEWKKIEEELSATSTGQLEPDLERAITDRLLPAYKKKQQIDSGQQRIAILGASLALIGGLFPAPFSWAIEVPLGLWLLQTIFKLAASKGIGVGTQRMIQWASRIGISVLVLALGTFGIATLFFVENASTDNAARTIEWAALCFSVILLATFYWLDRAVWKWSSRYVAVA